VLPAPEYNTSDTWDLFVSYTNLHGGMVTFHYCSSVDSCLWPATHVGVGVWFELGVRTKWVFYEFIWFILGLFNVAFSG
jgi:hypothetical protein